MKYRIYGAAGSGSVPVEAALTLIGAPFEVVVTPPPGKAITSATAWRPSIRCASCRPSSPRTARR